MSIKTLRKRIALVAVSALGAGLMSVAPASAVDYNLEAGITASASNQGLTVGLAAAAAGVPYAGVCDAGVPSSSTTPRTISVGGTSAVSVIKELAADNLAGGQLRITGPAKFTGGSLGYVDSVPTKFNVGTTESTSGADLAYYANFEVTGAGSIRIDAFSSSTDTSLLANSGTKVYSLFIYGVPACGTGPSADKSYAQLVTIDSKFLTLAQIASGRSSGSYAATGDRTATSAGTMDTNLDETTVFANGATAYIAVNTNNAQGYPYTTSSSAVVSCTNNATVEGTLNGYYVESSFAGYNTYAITQPTANAPLSTTCTITVAGVEVAKKSLKILGDAASIKLVNYKSGNAEGTSSSTNDGLFLYYIYDSAGNEVSQNATPAITSATTTTMVNTLTQSTAAVGLEDAYNNTYGIMRFNCLDYGTQKLSVKMTNAALVSITSNEIDVACGGAINTFTASLDKASYQTGDIATLTITAKDYAGGTPWTGTTLGGAGSGSFSIALGGMTAVTTPASGDTNNVRNTGVWTYTYKVDTTAGSFNGQVQLPTLKTTSPNYNKPTMLQYKIVASDAGVTNAEVLAAIVKLIASINKQIRALQKSIKK